MFWKDSLWSACVYSMEKAIGGAAVACEGLGSLACVIGGAGYASASALKGYLGGAYYGSAHAVGDVSVKIYVSQYNYTYSQDIPLDRTYSTSGSIGESISDYCNPDTLITYSTALATIGSAIRLIGANLRTLHNQLEDKRYALATFHNNLKNPSIDEHLCRNGASFFGSLSLVFSTYAVVGGWINFSRFISEGGYWTYPSSSSSYANSTNYNGPVNSTSLPFQGHLDKNATLNLPIVGDLDIFLEVNAIGLVNGTYGGDVEINPSSNSSFPIAAPIVVGLSSFLTQGFFANKVKQHRDERFIKASRVGFNLLV